MADLSIVHVRDDVCEVKDPVVMGDDNHGAVRMHRRVGEKFHDGFARGVIQGRRWFVADDQAGFMDERAGEGDALLLAAGKLTRKGLGTVSKSQSVQQLASPFDGLGAFHAGGEQGYGGVFGGIQRREQIVLLEDKAEIAPPEQHALLLRHPGETLSKQRHVAGGRVKQSGDDRDEGSFAAAAGPDEEAELAACGGVIHATEHFDPGLAIPEMFPDGEAFNGLGGLGVHGVSTEDRGRLEALHVAEADEDRAARN